MTISVCVGVSAFTPSGSMCTIGCEKPSERFSLLPCACARYPTPTSARRFSKPWRTPWTMLATLARSVPESALDSLLSSAAANTTLLPSRLTVTRGPSACLSVPSGPFTTSSVAAMVTSTFSGSTMGLLAMRDMTFSSDDDAEHFAADAGVARLAVGHDAARGRHDRNPQAVHDARNVVLGLVDAQPRTRHALDLLDHGLAGVVLEADLDHGLALVFANGEILDV